MVKIYDTTLRDGSQGVGINFTLEDKLLIAQKLDELGIHYIEGGWPHSSNIKDVEFFRKIKECNIRAKIVAFGSTKKPNSDIRTDSLINDLLLADTSTIAIFGKSWDLHVTDVIGTTLEENLNMIRSSVAYLKEHKKEVFYDAEHFFDGYKANKDYALKTLLSAQYAGADAIILCDTNGGCLQDEIKNIFSEVKNIIKIPLGIHCHNDIGLAVANTLVAVQDGAMQVQGTINGFGERCGNTDLCTLIPNLKLKLNIDCIGKEQLKRLKEVSNLVSELTNKKPFENRPYVGEYAFTHKGGMHIDGVLKNKTTFEHIAPELVGNKTNLLVSEQAGRGMIHTKLKELGFTYGKKSSEVEKVLERVKEKEMLGYTYEAADASFELMVFDVLNKFHKPFTVDHYEICTNQKADEEIVSNAKICININDNIQCAQAGGNGPVNALDVALRQVLTSIYKEIQNMELIDYKVRVLTGKEGTASKVRVLIEFSDKHTQWNTVGVSANVVEASLGALIEGFYYFIHHNGLTVK